MGDRLWEQNRRAGYGLWAMGYGNKTEEQAMGYGLWAMGRKQKSRLWAMGGGLGVRAASFDEFAEHSADFGASIIKPGEFIPFEIVYLAGNLKLCAKLGK